MTPDDQDNNHFEASLPLPEEARPAKQSSNSAIPKNPAADLIRAKVAAAYSHEPNAATEALDMAELGIKKGRSRHQQFIEELTNSGKSLAEIQDSWHTYYAGLSDVEKHEVWKEFYDAHAQASKFAAAAPAVAPAETEPKTVSRKRSTTHKRVSAPKTTAARTIDDLRRAIVGRGSSSRKKMTARGHLRSLGFGLGIGSIVVLIFLFSFFNERFIAPFIQPSRSITSTPVISSGGVIGPSPEIIIPKINVEIPVVYGVDTISEASVEKALESGVVHYADTAVPGQNGNVVIVGHSSNNIFNRGKYKFAFVLLSRLDKGDTFYLHKDGRRYTYQVYDKEIVKPQDVSVLGLTDKLATATLITCDPPGTSINRLVVRGEQISPSPGKNIAASTKNTLAVQSSKIPGDSQTLWSRILEWLKR